MTRDVRPYRWDLLRKIDRRQYRLFEGLAGRWPCPTTRGEAPPALSPLAAAVGPLLVYDAAALRERAGDPTAFALRLRRDDGAVGYVVVPGALAARCAERVLRGARSPMSGAPRAATRAERGVCAFVGAALLERHGIDGVGVELCHELPPTLLEPLGAGGSCGLGSDVSVEVAGVRGTVFLVVSEAAALAPPPTQSVEVSSFRGAHRLDGLHVTARILSGAGRLPLRDVLDLSRRDVVLLDRPPRTDAGRLAVGRGGFPLTIEDAGAVIAGPYERGAIMDEAVADDVTVEVACQLGAVQLSARRVLELAPGHVLPLDRPLGGPVELVVGKRSIGTGELFDVDGELGVRVLSLSQR